MKRKQADSNILKVKNIQSAEFYSQIIDSLHDYSIFTTDQELRINSWNAGSKKLFGYVAQEVMGKPCELIYTEEDKRNDILKKKIDIALKEGRVTDSRWLKCKDGSTFYAQGLIFPIMASNGELLGFVKILRNLTERKKSEDAIQKYIRELEELNTHKENILAILSHDLRSPLGTIVGIANYLKAAIDHMDINEVKHMVDIIDKASTNELNMLDYLLEWARIKYASEVFTPTTLDLVQYVQSVLDTLSEVAAQKEIQLNYEIEKDTVVFADEKMLLSILQNLVSNAINYSHQEGTITIKAMVKEDKVVVQVNDTGFGMSKEKQEKLFTPQISFLSEAKKEGKGGGIGLLLVKSFLKRNAGEIWVESAEDQGTSFYFSLPIHGPSERIQNADQFEFDEST